MGVNLGVETPLSRAEFRLKFSNSPPLLIGHFGPHPPRDDGPHHYHFEVFCLDTPLNLRPGATRSEVMAAMAGHVLAKGELVGLYEAPLGSDR